MSITKKIEAETTRIAITGRLDADACRRFEGMIAELSRDEIAKVYVDCAAMDSINSAGLHVFLNVAKKCKAANGELVLHSLNRTVSSIFEATGFSKIIPLS